MRIYRRDAFLALPPGTVYCKGVPMVFGGIQIKGEGLLGYDGRPIDWYYRDPAEIDAAGSGEQAERLEQMLDLDASYPLGTYIQRDGCFDPDEIFLVYEPEDVRTLIGWLDAATREV